MPTWRTGPLRNNGIRYSSPNHRPAGKPGSPDHRSGRCRVLRPQPSRLPKSPKPKCASQSPFGLAAAIGLHFRLGAEEGVHVAIGIPAGGRRLALLVARETAIAAAGAEIAALDAVGVIARG